MSSLSSHLSAKYQERSLNDKWNTWIKISLNYWTRVSTIWHQSLKCYWTKSFQLLPKESSTFPKLYMRPFWKVTLSDCTCMMSSSASDTETAGLAKASLCFKTRLLTTTTCSVTQKSQKVFSKYQYQVVGKLWHCSENWTLANNRYILLSWFKI